MGFYDGPLLIGGSNFPIDANTRAAQIFQIQAGLPIQVHFETVPNYRIGFFDGLYWSVDNKVYIVGSEYESVPRLGHGAVWAWDGTTLTKDFSIPATLMRDNFAVVTITEYKGALYVGAMNTVAANPLGGRIFRKTSAGGAWTEVHNDLTPGKLGPGFIYSDTSFLTGDVLIAIYGQQSSGPPDFYTSPTGDLGSWAGGVIGPPIADGAYLFFDGTWWIYGENTPFGHNYFWANTLAGPWNGPLAIPGPRDCSGLGYNSGLKEIMFDGDPSIYRWILGFWTPYRVEPNPLRARLFGTRMSMDEWNGSWYIPVWDGVMPSGYVKDMDPAVPIPDMWFGVTAFVSTPTSPPIPPTWDIVDIEPSDWGTGPFCDEASANVTVYAGSHLEITADKGNLDPAYYELSFGLSCPDLPDNWDLQLDLELDAIPRLHDDDESRLVISVHETNTSRKTAIQITSQGVAYYGMDEYSDLIPGSNAYITDGEVTLKLTGLGTDAEHRSYLALESSLRYQRGFPSYLKTGSIDKLRIEAVGTALKPTSIKVKAIRVRTHQFEPETDPYSIDAVRPKAVIA